MTSNQKYSKVTVAIHWIMAFLILVMFSVAWIRDIAGPQNEGIFIGVHKSIGVILLGLLVFRVIWRFRVPSPPPLPSWSESTIKIAHLGHMLIYGLMTIVLLSGFLMSVFGKYGIVWFGIPLIPGMGLKEISHVFKEVHEQSIWALLVVVTGHGIAALKHKIVDKDKTIDRMSF